MTLISEAYREQNRRLHETNADYGTSSSMWTEMIEQLMVREGYRSALDYGAGKCLLAKSLPDIPIVSYDPAIPGLDKKPSAADLVVCTDVLEHIEPEHLADVLRHLHRLTKRKLFVSIATRPADKVLSDGRNAHLIIQNAAWWRFRLSHYFQVLTWEARQGVVFGELFPLSVSKRMSFKPPTKRRPATPEMAKFFDWVKQEASKYNDAFNRIETVSLWQGVGDQPADMQAAANVLQDWPDPDAALEDICRLARKAVMLSIILGDGRSSDDWRKFVEQRLRISEWREIGNQILVIGSPMVNVAGVVAVGAVSSDERWVQVEAALKRYSRRIDAAPAHGRRAILACYGPSLASTIHIIKREMEAHQDVDVVSVSGAHDFLLSHGIVPRYHVECDPRAHKADNIDAMCPDTAYLLASCVSPALFDKLGPDADIRLWHISSTEHTLRLVDEHGEKAEHIIMGGGSVGLRSIPLLYAMGYRKIDAHALDCSFAEGGAKQWAGRHFGKPQDLCQVKCGERIFVSSPTLLSYATNFWEMVQRVGDLDINLYGDGLLQAMTRYFQGVPQTAHIKAA